MCEHVDCIGLGLESIRCNPSKSIVLGRSWLAILVWWIEPEKHGTNNSYPVVAQSSPGSFTPAAHDGSRRCGLRRTVVGTRRKRLRIEDRTFGPTRIGCTDSQSRDASTPALPSLPAAFAISTSPTSVHSRGSLRRNFSPGRQPDRHGRNHVTTPFLMRIMASLDGRSGGSSPPMSMTACGEMTRSSHRNWTLGPG